MSAWILAVWLLLSPLPGVSALPNGSELKLVSADLRTIYVSYKVEDRKLVASAPRLPLGGVREVRTLTVTTASTATNNYNVVLNDATAVNVTATNRGIRMPTLQIM